ncbi:MAG: MBL fold metallo-hydrolase, partial [Adlercreutzia sp.]|nr:MBL fold metallo-hydrolase [Adlercreutzia sp.]
MTKENQPKSSPKSDNGSGSGKGQNSSRRNDRRKNNTSYKRVNLERKRPQLSRGEAAEAQKGGDGRAKQSRRGSQNAKDPNKKLKIIPLGGLDAIGKNMTAFECDGDMILDDAGLMFPDDDHPGIDLILPDYTYVLENADKLRGIVVTHGHEDHTGSLPYLLKDLDRTVNIYATKLTLGLIE